MKKILLLLIILFSLTYADAQIPNNPVSNVTTPGVNEAEAHIAINPSDSSQMAVGFMSQSGSLGFKVYYSIDAGNSWTQSTFNAAQLSTPLFPGAIIAGGGDILLAYDKSGKLYVSWIYLYYKVASDSAFFTGFWASSTNAGQSFQFENVNQSDEFFGRGILTSGLTNITNQYEGVCDRQWMAVDHTNGPRANNLYIGFVNYTNTFGGLKARTKNPSNTFFNPPKTVTTGSHQLSNLAVDNNGTLHYTYAQVDGANGIYHKSSTDGGNTFSTAHLVSSTINAFPSSHPINDRVNAAPSLAIDGQNNLHVSWSSYPSNQPPIAYYAYSTDGGITWSNPLNLSTPINLGTFFANVCAAGNKVSISTYGIDASEKADYYLLNSEDNGQNFGPPIKLTSQQSNFATFAATDFAGDYTSSARNGCQTYSVWSDLRAGGQPKLYLSSYNDCTPVGFQELTTINSPFQIKNIFPNPTVDFLNIRMTSDELLNINIALYSVEGKLIQTEKSRLVKGEQQVQISTSNLASGNYYLILSDEQGNKLSRKFVK